MSWLTRVNVKPEHSVQSESVGDYAVYPPTPTYTSRVQKARAYHVVYHELPIMESGSSRTVVDGLLHALPLIYIVLLGRWRCDHRWTNI